MRVKEIARQYNIDPKEFYHFLQRNTKTLQFENTRSSADVPPENVAYYVELFRKECQEKEEEKEKRNAMPQAYDVPESVKFPDAGSYLAFVVVGFVLGVLWGFLSLCPYRNLKAAIAANDLAAANANAQKIKTILTIAIVVNVVIAVITAVFYSAVMLSLV